jgi:CRP/FNR family transcriptional regulator
MQHHTNCFLKKYALPEWEAAIDSNSKLLNFKKGQAIFREEDPVTGFYFLHEGKVKIHKKWGADKELIIKLAKEGDVLGHRGIGAEQHYPVSATAIEEASVCFISTEFLKTSLRINPELTYQLMLYYAKDLQEAEKGMRNMVHMDVKSRIADTVLKIAEVFGCDKDGTIKGALTRQDVASYAGTTYETIFKVMNEFAADHIIELSGKTIIIKNREKLSSVIKQG